MKKRLLIILIGICIIAIMAVPLMMAGCDGEEETTTTTPPTTETTTTTNGSKAASSSERARSAWSRANWR